MSPFVSEEYKRKDCEGSGVLLTKDVVGRTRPVDVFESVKTGTGEVARGGTRSCTQSKDKSESLKRRTSDNTPPLHKRGVESLYPNDTSQTTSRRWDLIWEKTEFSGSNLGEKVFTNDWRGGGGFDPVPRETRSVWDTKKDSVGRSEGRGEGSGSRRDSVPYHTRYSSR